jgi:hypothetical protein
MATAGCQSDYPGAPPSDRCGQAAGAMKLGGQPTAGKAEINTGNIAAVGRIARH